MLTHKKPNRKMRIMGELASLGIQFPVSIGIGYLIGRFLDKLFKTAPVLTIAFSVFGVIAAFVNVFRLNAELTRIEDEEKKDHEDGENTNGEN